MSTANALFPLLHASDTDRLGDEIARLSVQLNIAMARLLTLSGSSTIDKGGGAVASARAPTGWLGEWVST